MEMQSPTKSELESNVNYSSLQKVLINSRSVETLSRNSARNGLYDNGPYGVATAVPQRNFKLKSETNGANSGIGVSYSNSNVL
jgi:hypothetical protein